MNPKVLIIHRNSKAFINRYCCKIRQVMHYDILTTLAKRHMNFDHVTNGH